MARARSTSRASRASRRTGAYPGAIRIIGGRWRSRRLPVLTSEGLRPTPDRVRETLFNWLEPIIEGASCLDLFAGTGALCLEALSRGAATVVMVERSATAQRQLRENVERLGAAGAQVVAADAFDYLGGTPRAFDIVFLDPPFAVAAEMISDCGARLARGWLRPGALVYVEAPRAMRTPPVPGEWTLKKRGLAGQVNYLLFQAPPAPG
ncbi:MAG TPA: 16S rRNA (guanine(966)-N(2))-methyltransferase RsmD [Burkholderiales bacterium]